MTHTKCVIKYFDPSNPRQVKYATSAYFFENRSYLPNSNILSPGSKLANNENCDDFPELDFKIIDHPYLDSSPETISIDFQQYLSSSTPSSDLGLYIKECDYYGMPYIETICSSSPIRRAFPSQYRNNTWIISIGNREPSTASTAINLIRQQYQNHRTIRLTVAKRSSKEQHHRGSIQDYRSAFNQIKMTNKKLYPKSSLHSKPSPQDPIINKLVQSPTKPDSIEHIGQIKNNPFLSDWIDAIFEQYDKNHQTGTLSSPFPPQ